MFSPHPPEVVTLDILRDGAFSPHHDSSPLPSTPNSPRGSPAPGELDSSTLSNSFIDELEKYEERKKLLVSDSAPFDESGKRDDPSQPNDEKKTEEGDELMGVSPRKGGIMVFDESGSRPLDEEEPPSLSKVQTKSTLNAVISTPRRALSDLQDPEEEFEAMRMQHVTSRVTVNAEEGYMQTTNIHDPPSLLKKSMEWGTPQRRKALQGVAEVSPSPPSAVSSKVIEDEAPGDETEETEIPSALRPMVSPDGKLEYKFEVDDSDSEEEAARRQIEYVSHRKKPSFEEELEAPRQLAPFHPQGAVGLEPDTINELVGVDENSIFVQPRHSRTMSVPLDMQVDPLQELTSTLSDAVDLATVGASDAVKIVGDLLLGAESENSKSTTVADVADDYNPEPRPRSSSHEKEGNNLVRPVAGSMRRSVSDQPTSGVSKLTGDWNKYLTKNPMSALSIDTQKQGTMATKKTIYKQMTPKKDFQTSEKSAAWLQEEFRRRSTMKLEINKAILSRNNEAAGESPRELGSPAQQPLNDSFTKALANALEALPPDGASESTSRVDISIQSEDDEVAALTFNTLPAYEDRGVRASQVKPFESDNTPEPRRLDYGKSHDEEDIPRLPVVPPAMGRQNPMAAIVPDVLASPESKVKLANPPTETLHSNFENPLQQEMLRFVSTTRAALREETEKVIATTEDPTMMNSPFRSLARPTPTAAQPLVESLSRGAETTSSAGTEVDLSALPVLVKSMDGPLGIEKGDITLSLLNDNTTKSETNVPSAWANRVRGAIWRCRHMRRSFGALPSLPVAALPKGSPPRGRSSLPVDLDKARVAGGVRNVKATQDAALGHLQHDEIEEAIELFEDIIFAYYSYFDRSLKEREANPGVQIGNTTDFKAYIGVALHNLGILNLLKGEYNIALSYFSRALDNRKVSLGEGHPEYVTTLTKLATCHFALNGFAEAHSRFEQALKYSRKSAQTLEDRMLMSEILNNLGCLAYMCGQPTAADAFYKESLDVQFGLLSHSLYLPSTTLPKSISLSISVTRANIGFLKLVKKEVSIAVTALENALMEQQLLLSGANTTLIATMDHLAVANLLNGNHMKAEMMFGRILELQQIEYGPRDRRCFVTADKINMVRSKGSNFEHAIEELRKTFSLPTATRTTSSGSPSKAAPPRTAQKTTTRGTAPKSKNKVMKVFTSIRKKKPTATPAVR